MLQESSSSKPLNAPSQSHYNLHVPSSRPHSRDSPREPLSYATVPENLVFPEAPISEETVELLDELVHPHRHEEEDALFGRRNSVREQLEDDDDISSPEARERLPWYKRPSPIWFLLLIPLGGTAVGATLAPRIEIFTRIVCEVLRPEWSIGLGADSGLFDIDKRRLCAADPVVQAEVAKLSAVTSATFGVLSCFTTAWWGSLCDRYGRTRILSICIFGMIMTDINFIVVFRFYKVLPGGYWFLILGPVLDGLLGGVNAFQAGIQAYFADCTPSGTRSRIFSLYLGLLYTGTAIGPTLGSIIIRLSGSLTSVFYIAAAVHILYAVAVTIFVPESLSKRRILEFRRLHAEVTRAAKDAPKKHRLLTTFLKIFGFLSPLSLFYQAPIVVNGTRSRKNWNLTLVAISFGCVVSLLGTYAYKLQYAGSTFGWTSEQLGYWLSTIGFTGAIYLTLILPAIIKLMKGKPPIQLSVTPDEPLQPTAASSSSHPISSSPTRSAKPDTDTHALAFDLALARGSLLFELVSHLLIPFAPNGAVYTGLTVLGVLGAGFSPAVQSVALGLYTQQGGTELGKLFGAWNVMSSLSSQIIGPAIYGMTFMWTVAKFPSAIFFTAAAVAATAFVMLSFVRLPKPPAANPEVGALATEGHHDNSLDPEVPSDVVTSSRTSSSPGAQAGLVEV